MDCSSIQWFAISCKHELENITKSDLSALLPKGNIPKEWSAMPAKHEIKLTIGEFLELLSGRSLQQKKASPSLFQPKEEPCVLIDDDAYHQHAQFGNS